MPTEPSRILSLRADSNAVVQIGGETARVVRNCVEGEKRSRLWDRIRTGCPIHEDQWSTANHDIPMFGWAPVE